MVTVQEINQINDKLQALLEAKDDLETNDGTEDDYVVYLDGTRFRAPSVVFGALKKSALAYLYEEIETLKDSLRAKGISP